MLTIKGNATNVGQWLLLGLRGRLKIEHTNTPEHDSQLNTASPIRPIVLLPWCTRTSCLQSVARPKQPFHQHSASAFQNPDLEAARLAHRYRLDSAHGQIPEVAAQHGTPYILALQARVASAALSLCCAVHTHHTSAPTN